MTPTGRVDWAPGRILACTILAAFVFCCRAWLMCDWGSPVPLWDQWDAEAFSLYLPWLNGTYHWLDLFRAHNEHRIVLTRVTDLALFATLGAWSPWAQMIVNAMLHATTAAAVASIFWFATPNQNRAGLIAGIALLFTAFCGWQNALWGFQSQVYFTSLFSVGAIAGLCLCRSFSFGWWLGMFAALMALFTTGGGVFAVCAVLLVKLGFAGRAGRNWIALGMIIAVVALGLALSQSVSYHVPLRARTFTQFFTVFAHCLAWPWVDDWAFCFIMPLPLAWLVFNRWRRNEPLDSVEQCALALGCLGVLHSAAIAYSRGAGLVDARPLSRYQDPLLLGFAAQFFAAMRLWTTEGRVTRIILLLGGGLALGGLIKLTETNLSLHLPYKRAQDRASLTMIRTYNATRDPSAFTRDPLFSGPHPDPRSVIRVLDDPKLRSILPTTLLASPDGPPPSPPWIIRHGLASTAVSATIFFAVLLCLQRKNKPRHELPAEKG